MTLREWDWARYPPCDQCEAPAAVACINLLRKDRCPRVRPHHGRQRRPAPYRAPRKSSRLAEICIGVLAAANKRPSDLVEPLGWHFNTIYRAFSEEKRPMTVVKAEKILAVLGYRLEHRAVPAVPQEQAEGAS